jgi:hypothetical protein
VDNASYLHPMIANCTGKGVIVSLVSKGTCRDVLYRIVSMRVDATSLVVSNRETRGSLGFG